MGFLPSYQSGNMYIGFAELSESEEVWAEYLAEMFMRLAESRSSTHSFVHSETDHAVHAHRE